MTTSVTLLGSQAAAPTGTGTATNISGARTVECYQGGSTARLITVQNVAGVVQGTITLPATAGSLLYITKGIDEEMFAASDEVLFTPIRLHYKDD